MSEQDTANKTRASQSEALHLLAFENDDLAVLSANLQDALVRIADMAYLPRERRFALLCQRFDWIAAEKGRKERCQTGLHFDAVRKVSIQGFDQTRKDRVLNLLSITFEPSDTPAGTVLLTFSAGGAVRLDVDYLEAQMSDLDLRWKARRRPGHKIDEAGPG